MTICSYNGCKIDYDKYGDCKECIFVGCPNLMCYIHSKKMKRLFYCKSCKGIYCQEHVNKVDKQYNGYCSEPCKFEGLRLFRNCMIWIIIYSALIINLFFIGILAIHKHLEIIDNIGLLISTTSFGALLIIIVLLAILFLYKKTEYLKQLINI